MNEITIQSIGRSWQTTCTTCGAVVGSAGMPEECHYLIQEERDREPVMKKIGVKNERLD